MPLTQEAVQSRLRKRKIALLDAKYVSYRHPHRFKCRQGHKWTTTLANVMKTSVGCPTCAYARNGQRSRFTQEQAEARLQKKGIELLGPFRGLSAEHKLRCAEGHVWKGRWVFDKTKGGCPECKSLNTAERNRITKSEVQSRLKRKGLALVGSFRGVEAEAKLRCREGHQWTALIKTVLYTDGCCKTCHPHRHGVSEGEVRRTIQRLTGWKFPKARPEWLHGLELDGYNERHAVAFEYQGFQHYQPSHWSGEEGLCKQKLNDKRKRMQCLRHDVLLICVPYWTKNVEEFLRKKLRASAV